MVIFDSYVAMLVYQSRYGRKYACSQEVIIGLFTLFTNGSFHQEFEFNQRPLVWDSPELIRIVLVSSQQVRGDFY